MSWEISTFMQRVYHRFCQVKPNLSPSRYPLAIYHHMVILHKLFFFMWRGYSFDDVCSMDDEAQNLTQCWMNHEDHENNPKCSRYS